MARARPNHSLSDAEESPFHSVQTPVGRVRADRGDSPAERFAVRRGGDRNDAIDAVAELLGGQSNLMREINREMMSGGPDLVGAIDSWVRRLNNICGDLTELHNSPIAIRDVVHVDIGGMVYAVDKSSVVATIYTPSSVSLSSEGDLTVLRYRNADIRVVDLAAILEHGAATSVSWKMILVCKLKTGEAISFPVDGILGQGQAVIKPVDDVADYPGEINMTATLPDGQVAMVLDIDIICEQIEASIASLP